MESIQNLPLSALRESPFNPRKAYPEAALQELANSIKSQGVMQPIVVRPIGNLADADFTEPAYEIVFGHRRFRASQLAGLDSVPTILREMDDEQTAIAQVHENTKRADVTALEEADSFTHLNKAHHMSADAIAEAVGKSRSYVYGRIKLANAAPEVRAACETLGLSPETALDLARMPDHAQQRAALKDLRDKYSQTPEQPIVWLSVRNARAKITGMFSTRLTGAAFDLECATLSPGAGACTTCPRRAGNDPDLVSLPADTCTDKDCFGDKTARAVAKVKQANLDRIANWRESGGIVIEGESARQIWSWNYPGCLRGYTPVTELVDEDDDELGSIADALAGMEAAPATVLILNPHDHTDLQEYIADADLPQLLKHLGLDEDDDTQDEQAEPAGNSSDYSNWSSAELLARDSNAWLNVRKAVIATIPNRARTVDCLRAVLLHELHQAGGFDLAGKVLGWTDRFDAEAQSDTSERSEAQIYTDLINAASGDELAALITAVAVDTLLGNQTYHQATATERVALAQSYGVDPLSVIASQAIAAPDSADEDDEQAAAA